VGASYRTPYWKEPERVSEKDKKFEIAGETMYGGQGKNRLLNINQHELSETKKENGGHREDQAIQDVKTLYDGLSQPRLNDTDKVILGHNKTKIRRENKQRRQNKQANQQIKSPWTSYKGVKLEQPTPPTDHTTVE
jgi:hypothetical protein